MPSLSRVAAFNSLRAASRCDTGIRARDLLFCDTDKSVCFTLTWVRRASVRESVCGAGILPAKCFS
ncbi:MAG TPA: hypothetical protein PKH07_19545, partial [bacterium]|nr:hypothetical protein [bacterium]